MYLAWKAVRCVGERSPLIKAKRVASDLWAEHFYDLVGCISDKSGCVEVDRTASLERWYHPCMAALAITGNETCRLTILQGMFVSAFPRHRMCGIASIGTELKQQIRTSTYNTSTITNPIKMTNVRY